MTGPPPGLDRAALLALRRPRHDLAAITARVAAHLHEHHGYVAFSGGKDSLVTLHLALAADPAVPVVFFDSGLEFPETYRYIGDLAARWDLRISRIPAEPPLLQALRASRAWEHGTGPALPAGLHRTLITIPAARAHQAHGPGELWGVRAAESRGRAAMYGRGLRAEAARACAGCCDSPASRARRHGGVIRRADGTVAYGPAWRWTASDVWAYIARHQLPVNPVYDILRGLGAPEQALRVSCMIEANGLQFGRATWLRRGWPGLFEELAAVLPRLREFA